MAVGEVMADTEVVMALPMEQTMGVEEATEVTEVPATKVVMAVAVAVVVVVTEGMAGLKPPMVALRSTIHKDSVDEAEAEEEVVTSAHLLKYQLFNELLYHISHISTPFKLYVRDVKSFTLA